MSEQQIRGFLDAALGEAPRPEWGIPGGWHGYLAVLLGWSRGQDVSPDDAARCAGREPGRAYSADADCMHRLGVRPELWEVPLRLDRVRRTNDEAVAVSALGELGSAPMQLTQPSSQPSSRPVVVETAGPSAPTRVHHHMLHHLHQRQVQPQVQPQVQQDIDALFDPMMLEQLPSRVLSQNAQIILEILSRRLPGIMGREACIGQHPTMSQTDRNHVKHRYCMMRACGDAVLSIHETIVD